MEKKFIESSELNRQELRNRAVSLYEAIEDDEIEEIMKDGDKSSLKKASQLICQKLNILFDECIGESEFTLKNLFSGMSQKYFELHQEKVDDIIDRQIQIEESLKKKIKNLEQQNRDCTAKYLRLQDQLRYQINLNEQIKQKFLTGQQSASIQKEKPIQVNILVQLKKKCLEMQAQIIKKNQIISQLQIDLQLLQPDHNHKSFKMKFNKNCQSLLNEVTKKISDISSLFQDLKKTEQFYQNVEKKFEQRKKHLQKNMVEEKKALSQLNSRMMTLLKQKSQLESIVIEEKKTIQTYKQTIGKYQQVIKQLESQNSRLKCMIAERQADFQTYKKALQLTVQCYVTKKIEALTKFCFIQKDQRLKQLLKRVLKK